MMEELRLLQAAQRQLRTGDTGAALESLAEHARRFPSGVLREERRASRVIALCQAGLLAEGRAEAKRFVNTSPGSPFVQRVLDSCRDESMAIPR